MERTGKEVKWWEKTPLEVAKYISLVEIPGITEGPDNKLKLAHKVTITSVFLQTNPWEKVQRIAASLSECGFSFLPSDDPEAVIMGRKESLNPPEGKTRKDFLEELDAKRAETGEGSPVWMTRLPH